MSPAPAGAAPASVPRILANDFRRQWADIGREVLAATARVGEDGWYVLGREVERFEQELARTWGLRHAAGVASGLDAIEIGLRVLGCQPGDRVLTTPLSAFATTLAIVKLGAVPVFVDTDERGLIDLAACRALLERDHAIRYFVPVHLYGHVLDLAELRLLRDDFDLRIVEDCAQSAGARMRGESTGTAGHIAATSFYPTKNLGAMGDGGAILTGDPALDAQVRVLRFYGETARYQHERIGYNSRLDELHAAILRQVALPRLTAWVEHRRHTAEAYLGGIRHPEVRVPGAPVGSRSSWHLFPVHVAPARRSSLIEHLKVSGIATGIHYPTAIPDQPALHDAPFGMADDCETARMICASEISLPIHPYLSSEEVETVIDAINAWPASIAAPA